MEYPSYYSIMTADVRYDKRLGKPNPRELYSEITALSNKDGYCHASNAYFAKLYGISSDTISRWVTLLERCGYLQREIIYKENSKEVKERRLYPISTPPRRKIDTPPQKEQEGIARKIDTPPRRKRKDNSTSINNTSTNTYGGGGKYIYIADQQVDKLHDLGILNGDQIRYLYAVDSAVITYINRWAATANQNKVAYAVAIIKRLMNDGIMTAADVDSNKYTSKQPPRVEPDELPNIDIIKLYD